ncbi:MAG: hypothetical protein HQK84_03155 [Nitrospinae bacterium]|nr:hypothetical protein [Nitrospinota bacterium]
MIFCRYTPLFIFFFLFLFSSQSHGEENIFMEAFNNRSVTGYIENKSAFRLKKPNRFSKLLNTLSLETETSFLDGFRVYGRNRLEYDAVYDIEKAYANVPYREYRLNWDFNGIVQELYLEYYYNKGAFRIGKQQVVWGEATGLKITDIVNPMDLKEFILDDFLNSRIGLWMLKLNRSLGSSELEAVIIPDFEGNKAAVRGSEWAMNIPSYWSGYLPIVNPTQKPTDSLKNSDVGLRWNSIINSWDISLYYLYAWDDDPTLHTITRGFLKYVTPKHHRLHTMGGTFNYAWGKFVFSGELAAYLNKYYQTSDTNIIDGVVKKNYLHYMLGSDYILNSFTNLSFQIIQKIILGNTQYLRNDAVETTLTFMAQMDFLNETLKPEFFVIYGANNAEWLIKSKVSYAWNDYLKLTAGVDIFEGPQTDAIIGQFKNNNRFTASIRYSF